MVFITLLIQPALFSEEFNKASKRTMHANSSIQTYIFCDLQTELIVLFIKLDVEWIACHGIVGSLPNYKILLYVGQRSVGICLYCTKYVRFPE